MITRFCSKSTGLLTFEWILLLSILVIGVIAGLSAVRDSLNSELTDVSAAVVNINQSYSAHQVDSKVSRRPPTVNGVQSGYVSGGNFVSKSYVNSQENNDTMGMQVIYSTGE